MPRPITGPGPVVDAEMLRAAAALAALRNTWRSLSVGLPPGVPHLPAAEARLASGVAALTGEPLLDGAALLAHARAIAAALGAVEGFDAAGEVVEHICGAAADIDLDALASAALSGRWDGAEDIAARLDLDGYALTTLLDYAVRPALRAGAAAVQPLVAAAAWGRGHCPSCGAPPTLATVRGKEGDRFLHCGRCGSGWAFARVRCAACGERDHRKLGVLHGAGEGDYRRVEVCESCRAYLKSVAALSAPDADKVLELDLETAGLDFVAVERGYGRRTFE
jgi:formate dehydrogenase accessory protein FdhE